MSGGSYNYQYSQVDEEYVGHMYDKELDDMMSDLVTLLHDLEWWQSDDYNEEQYRKTVRQFKGKWFSTDRSERLTKYIDDAVEELSKQLHEMIKA